MRFGILFTNSAFPTPDAAETLASAVEEFGIESIWTVEHVVVPKDYESPYPYSSSGRMPGPEESPIPDPLIWLSWMAAKTETVRLCTGILILPQRSPAIVAKEVATLDVLSRGRVTLGVGVGWLKEEFDVIGVPFEERAGRTDEAIEALRVLWTEDEPTFHGRYYGFTAAKLYPRPVQPGGVPIVVGGHTKAAARRAGRLGDGFFPARATPDELVALLEEVRRGAEEAGRDFSRIEITLGGARDAEGVRRYADLGVSRMLMNPPGRDPDSLREGLARFADEVMAKV